MLAAGQHRPRAARCEEADSMSEIRVQLHSWLALQREALPLAVRADALRRTLQACPEVRQAFFLGWQPGTGIYSREGSAPHMPPGFGDPLQASDRLLFEALAQQPRLDLAELRGLPCWLAGRVRRAALSHGQVLALELDAGRPGLLLIELQEGVSLDWLGFIHELLLALLASLPAPTRPRAPPPGVPARPPRRGRARCRRPPAAVGAGRGGAKARRLYRLITENTTALISRHTPD